jgi:hypothetical protein
LLVRDEIEGHLFYPLNVQAVSPCERFIPLSLVGSWLFNASGFSSGQVVCSHVSNSEAGSRQTQCFRFFIAHTAKIAGGENTVSFEIKGLQELSDKLKDLGERGKQLDGNHEVPITELLTPTFLSSCSQFTSAEELFAASGFKIESTEDFKAIPQDQWDAFIKSNTSFGNWKEMLAEAAKTWTANQLRL